MPVTDTGAPLNLPKMSLDGEPLPSAVYNDAMDQINANAAWAAWAAWVPTWVNLTVGNGTVTAQYLQVGKLVVCRLNFTLGSTSSISGDLSFTLPVNRAAFGGEDGLNPLGPVRFYDVSAGFVYEGVVVSPTVSTAILRAFDASGTYLRGVLMSGTVPFTWASPDEFSAQFSYEAA